MPLQVEDLGLVPYEQAHRLQLERLEERLAGLIPDTLLLLEHPTIITLGRGAHEQNILPHNNLPVVTCERGGDVSLHAPGQLMGYLIHLLPDGRHDLRRHLRLLEEILLRSLAEFGLAGQRVEGLTGVWIEQRKLASIGVACRRWCTWHGFSLNVSCDLELFSSIRPCGLSASVMTSMAEELGSCPDLGAVKESVARHAGALLEVAR